MSAPRAEPGAVPIRPASTLLLVADRPDLQVLVLRRRKASDFVGGMSVFPGGGVDDEDAGPEVAALADGLDEDLARRRLSVTQDALGFWMAAVRETFEEAGLLLARRPGVLTPIDLKDAATRDRFHAHRVEVDEGRALLADVLNNEGLRLATDLIHYIGRWITPRGPRRRYDTRFFLAEAPEAQTASADETEAVHAEWMRPDVALERFAAGELLMLPPTAGMLRILSGFATADEAVASAVESQDTADHPVQVAGDLRTQKWRVLLPGDADYDSKAGDDARSLAWVRLHSSRSRRSPIQGP